MRSCSTCKNRAFRTMFSMLGYDFCLDYEMASSEEKCVENARNCNNYEEGNPECFTEERYTSSTNRDYGPGNPWDAPGMSISDFI